MADHPRHISAPQPGPIDPSVLTEQDCHRSQAISDGEVLERLRFIEHSRIFDMWDVEHQGIMHILQKAGFYYVTRLKRIKLDQALLNALIERWRPETQTFHFRVGEMTITLRDVALLVGLLVDGQPVVATTDCDWQSLCQELLGAVPDGANAVKKGCVKLHWLRTTFSNIAPNAGQAEVECTTRAYILYLFGCHLFPDPSGNRVHLKWLQLLRDFDQCGQMAWGAAVLAHLYRELAKASMKGKAECCAYFTLVQLWAWEYLWVSRPEQVRLGGNYQPSLDGGPFGCRWNVRLNFTDNARTSNVEFYRNELDTQSETAVTWEPYTQDLIEKLPAICRAGREVWMSRTPLICYEIVEMHVPDRVMRQFGFVQHIPDPVELVERVTRQGRSNEDWVTYHRNHIEEWGKRLGNRVRQHDDVAENPARALELYMHWYWNITRRWITIPTDRPGTMYQPRGPAESVLVEAVRHIQSDLRRVMTDRPTLESAVDTITRLEAYVTSILQSHPFHDPPAPPMQHQEDVNGTPESLCRSKRCPQKCKRAKLVPSKNASDATPSSTSFMDQTTSTLAAPSSSSTPEISADGSASLQPSLFVNQLDGGILQLDMSGNIEPIAGLEIEVPKSDDINMGEMSKEDTKVPPVSTRPLLSSNASREVVQADTLKSSKQLTLVNQLNNVTSQQEQHGTELVADLYIRLSETDSTQMRDVRTEDTKVHSLVDNDVSSSTPINLEPSASAIDQVSAQPIDGITQIDCENCVDLDMSSFNVKKVHDASNVHEDLAMEDSADDTTTVQPSNQNRVHGKNKCCRQRGTKKKRKIYSQSFV